MSGVELLTNEVSPPRLAPIRHRFQMLTWCAVAVIVLAGSL